MKKRVKIAGIAAAVIVALAVVGAILLVVKGPAFAEFLAFGNLGPGELQKARTAYHAWREERLTLPPGALEVAPFTSATQAAARAFNAEWEKNKAQTEGFAKLEGAKLDNFAYSEITSLLVPLEPLMQAFAAVVGQPDYEMRSFAHGAANKSIDLPLPPFAAIDQAARLTRLGALAAAHEGRIRDALMLAETALGAAKCSRYSPLIDQMAGASLCSKGALVLDQIMLQCPDPALLRRSLALQNKLAGELDFITTPSLPMPASDHLAMLREYKRHGVRVDLQHPTALEITEKNMEAHALYLESKVLPTVQGDAARAKEVRRVIDGWHANAAEFGAGVATSGGWLGRLRADLNAPLIYQITVLTGRWEKGFNAARVALCRLDLLRLATARQLYIFEHGNPPVHAADLVPQYLPALPLDRFAKGKAPYRESPQGYYSVGPDGRDDGNRQPYDAAHPDAKGADLALP